MDKRAGLKQHFKDEANKDMTIQHHKERMQLAKDNQETLVHLMEALVDFLDKKVTKTEVLNQLKSISTPDVDKVVNAVEKLDKTITNNKVDNKPLLQEIKRELSLIPKTHAKQLDTFKVSNLKDIIIPKLDTSNLEELLEKLIKLADKDKAPIINTEKTDIKPLVDEMVNVAKAVKENKPLEKVEITNFPDQKLNDLTKIEKKLDESNKHLKKIVEKPVGGGGGGGGNGTPYIDSTGKPMNVVLTEDGKIPVDVDMAAEGIATEATLAKINLNIDWGLYALKNDSATVTYIVQTSSTGAWQVVKVDSTTGYDVSVADVTNNPSITTVADALTNRATLTYRLGVF